MEIRRLVKPSELKIFVPISSSVDEELLKKVTYNEQITRIQNLLGTKLYTALIDEATDNNIDGKRKILIDEYIKPCLYQWSYRAAILHLNLRVTDKGVLTQSDTNAQQAEPARVSHLMNEAKNKAEFHANLAVKFICKNESSFPEYGDETFDDGVRPDKKPFDSGIVFG